MSRQKQILLQLFFLCTAALFFCAPVDAQKKNSKLSKYLNAQKWNELFPNRFDISTYDSPAGTKKKKQDFFSLKALLVATDSFPQFLSGDDTVRQKRELCAFLANIAYETGGGWDDAPGGYYKWGLYFSQEKGCEKGCPQYSDSTKIKYLPVPGQSYHGRGPLQISWNYNYGQFSEMYLHDKDKLLKDPGLVTTDPVICFASALWFWTTAQYPKPSCHDIMYDLWKPSPKDIAGGRTPGFGAVVNVINGGIECDYATTASSKYRYGYYLYFCKYFNVDPGPGVECANQKPFGQ